MFDWLKIKSTLADARNECKGMRATIAHNKLRIEELHSLPPPREELADMIAKFIDEASRIYPQKLAESLQHIIRNPTDDCKAKFHQCGDGRSAIRVLTATEHYNGTATPMTVETALFCLLGDQIKTGMRRVVQEMEYPAIVGPAMPARLAEIDELTKENADLEAKVKELELDLARTVDANG